jgi:lipoprotein NlpD
MNVCRFRKWFLPVIVPVLVYGCAAPRPAPIMERQPEILLPAPAAKTPAPVPAAREQDSRPEFYTVRKGDTLYSIALEYGLDYRDIAEWNNLGSAYAIGIGQQLRLRPPPATVVTAPLKAVPPVTGKPVGSPPAQRASNEMVKSQPKAVKTPYSDEAVAKLSGTPAPQPKPAAPTIAKVEPNAETKPAPQPEKPVTAEPDDEKVSWSWPVSGKVVAGFSESGNAKGLDIAGKLGQPVYAAAPGRVIFSGDGPRGYGKLIVVKHNNAFISVYAHNNDLLVSYGQTVTKGQKIAEMGSTDADRVKLHFEIRRFGKPVDPTKLLPDNPA